MKRPYPKPRRARSMGCPPTSRRPDRKAARTPKSGNDAPSHETKGE